MITTQDFYNYFQSKEIIERYHSKIENNCSTGLDKINPDAFSNQLSYYVNSIHTNVLSGKYEFTKYLETLSSKGRDKAPRVISKPTIKDKLTLSILHKLLDDICKNLLDKRLIHTKISEINKNIASYSHYIKIDIRAFYSNIDHSIIKEKIAEILPEEAINLISKAIKTPSVPRNFNSKTKPVKKPDKGVPEGLSISNILADIYLLDLDNYYNSVQSLHYCRFVDDILILCKKADSKHINDEIRSRLKALNLEINEEKSICDVTSNTNPFIYLGYTFFSNKTTVRQSSIDRFEFAIEKLFCDCRKSNTTEKLLEWKLNLKIAGCVVGRRKYGWLFYFSQITDLTILKHFDWYVNKLLKRFNYSKISVKNFVKAYHEIKYNLHDSDYFLHIDKLTDNEKLDILTNIFDKSISFNDDVNQVFYNLIKKDLLELERDIQFFS